jgi:hypothetical protein
MIFHRWSSKTCHRKTGHWTTYTAIHLFRTHAQRSTHQPL